jgi:hypothetical protein
MSSGRHDPSADPEPAGVSPTPSVGAAAEYEPDWGSADDFLRHKRHYYWLALIKGGRAVIRVIPAPLRRVAYDSIASISPDVPTNLQKLAGEPHGWRIFGYGFLAGLVLCFGMTLLFTVLAGTWSGTAPNTVYFREDWQNIVLYLFVCPAYVGWCVWMLALFVGRSATLGAFADEIGAPRRRFRIARFPVTVIAMLSLTALIVFGYIADILKVQNVPEAYWFMTAQTADGVRYLNSVGVYYVILNFCLMLITAAAVFCFFSMFFDTLRVGHGLRTMPASLPVEFPTVARRLATFTEAYLIAKLLCATYIVNVVVWRLSPLGATTNIELASMVLAAMGLFFISFPRYYVELMWRDYQERAGIRNEGFKDLRPARERVLVSVVDTFFISTFVFNYFSLAAADPESFLTDALVDAFKWMGIAN